MTNWYGTVRYETMSPRKDPIKRYLAILLADGDCYEGVSYRDAPNSMQVYCNGDFLASFVDRQSDATAGKASWFRFGPTSGPRIWNIQGADATEMGTIVVQRPVTQDSKFLVRLHGESDVWLNVARTTGLDCSLWNVPRLVRAIRTGRMPRILHSDRVLPRGYQIPVTRLAGQLHFVSSIAVRLFYRYLSFQGNVMRFREAEW